MMILSKQQINQITEMLTKELNRTMGDVTELSKEGNPNVSNILKPDSDNPQDLRNDIRKALIAYLKSK